MRGNKLPENDNLKIMLTLIVTEALAFSFLFFGILNLTHSLIFGLKISVMISSKR